MLELKNIYKRYHKSQKNAVDGLSFTLLPGEVMGLAGENGAGKSTTVSMIATLLKPDAGSILYQGSDIVQKPKAIRKRLGYVPQGVALYESLTGEENLRFWAAAYHTAKQDYQIQHKKVCGMIGFSQEILDKKVKEYSGGMKKRLNIAAALLHRPELVILDEPTAGIDIQSRDAVIEAVKELGREGTSVLYVGHYLEEIERACDRLCLIRHGKCVFNDTVSNLLKRNGGTATLEAVYREKCIADSGCSA